MTGLLDEDGIHHFVVQLIFDEDIEALEEARGNYWELNEYIHASKQSRYILPVALVVAHQRLKVLDYMLGFEELDLNHDDQPALPFAAPNLSVEWIARLIDHGASIYAENRVRNNVFDISIRENRVDVAQYLINLGFNISEAQYKDLRHAVWRKNIHLVRKLIEWGIDVSNGPPDMVFSTSQSALQLAVRNNDEEMIDLLLCAGADLSDVDEHGITPRLQAVKSGFTELANRLEKLEGHVARLHDVKNELSKQGVDQELIEFLSGPSRKLKFTSDGESAWIEFHFLADAPKLERFGFRYLSLSFDYKNSLYCGDMVWFFDESELGFVDYEHEELHKFCDWSEFLDDPGNAIAEMKHFFSAI